jgi:predicted RNA-binding Zn ribbon-like protein
LHFAPDTEETLRFAVALVDTHPKATRSGTDELDQPALTRLFEAFTYTGRFDRDDAELAEVRETRDLIKRIWTMPKTEAVDEVNAMFRDARALPFLTKHDHYDWHLHATEPDAPLAQRMRGEFAIAFADVIRSGATDRMRECDADDCEGLVLDLSRNGSKRFCSVRCGNRMNQLAFRSRAGDD